MAIGHRNAKQRLHDLAQILRCDLDLYSENGGSGSCPISLADLAKWLKGHQLRCPGVECWRVEMYIPTVAARRGASSCSVYSC